MLNIPFKIIEDVKAYGLNVEKYKNGELDETRFKAYRVPMGVYEERETGVYMVRTRIPSGIMSLEQLKAIKDIAEKYSHGKVHFTTRQDIQFHKVTIDNTIKIVEKLLDVGIITRGTGGNTPRNVVCSPLSGVSSDEIFDVSAYALATTEYLLKDSTNFNLPRKYKIVFSNSSKDTGHAKIADLGFIATVKDGKEGFKLYGGGGLGNSSRPSLLLKEFIEKNEFLIYVQALKELFEAEGNRKNKAIARIRHIVIRLGEEKFREELDRYVAKVKADKKIVNSELNNYSFEYISDKGTVIENKSQVVESLKTKGRYAVYYQPKNGNLDLIDINDLLNFIDSLDYEPSIRLDISQGFYIRELDGKDVETAVELGKKFSSGDKIDQLIACAGAATCKLGLCLSQNLGKAITERFEKENHDIKNRLPRIYISGCPNSCGQHHIGEIGLYGKARRVDGNLVPMYSIMFGGDFTPEVMELAKEYMDIPARTVPDFLVHLAKVKESDISFKEFLIKEDTKIRALLKKYSEVPSIDENEDFYKDFGKDELFSLRGRGAGECSVGVLDVIKTDIANAYSYLKEYKEYKEDKKLYEAGLSAFKSLLLLKGIETNKDREIFAGFKKEFIDMNYIKEDINKTIESLIDYKLGDNKSIESEYENIKYVTERVDEIFKSLDSKLEITVKKVGEELSDANENNQDEDFKIVDLKGVKCPINFVKAKIELSKIEAETEIGFYLDDGAPITNVPKSIQQEGHEVISIDDSFEGYNLLRVKKKSR